MEADDLMLTVVDVLIREQVPYLLVGSFSSNYWGIPRSTKDVDLVVELGGQPVQAITKHLDVRFQLQPQMSFESVTGTQRHILDIAGTQFQVELFRLSNDPHDRERFARRVNVPWSGRRVALPTAEDVIVTKLRWLSHLRRNKDWDDVQQVMSVQRDQLDWSYLQKWCALHETRNLLDQIRDSLPSA